MPEAKSNGHRQCTCHPDDDPPTPCARRYALRDCRIADVCENSQAPHDDCDRVAQRLGCAADAAAAKLMSIDDRIAKLEAELSWYGEQARLCRLIHSEGDAGRHALAADGGKRARQVLQK